MIAPWAVEEMRTSQLGDKRLDNRMVQVLSQLGSRPTGSIPAGCGGHAETTAAYRFFDNPKTSFANILQPHINATHKRIQEERVVIVAQDTTEIDVTRPEQQMKGTGPLDSGPRRGAFLHLHHAFKPNGTPLGTIQAKVWTRDGSVPRCSERTSSQRLAIPIEQKESYRWVEGIKHVQEISAAHPDTQFVCVADSEADIYELLVEATSHDSHPQRVDWIVRACHNRRLANARENSGESEQLAKDIPDANYLRDAMAPAPVLFTERITIRGRKLDYPCDRRRRRQPRNSRIAELEVRALRVQLGAPRRPHQKLPDISVNVVFVREVNAPDGEEPVEWILLTSLPIETNEQVRQVIAYYCIRWTIEVFYRTLKSGCRVESRRFEHIDRFLPCLAIYLIVTWRTLFVCHIAREVPDASCEMIFEPAEWKSVYQIVHRKPPPTTPPPLADFIRMLAQLGGYVNLPSRDPPGPQTVWLGMQRLHDFAVCWNSFGPGADAAHGDV